MDNAYKNIKKLTGSLNRLSFFYVHYSRQKFRIERLPTFYILPFDRAILFTVDTHQINQKENFKNCARLKLVTYNLMKAQNEEEKS